MKNAISASIRTWSAQKRVTAGFDGYIDQILRVQGIDRMEVFGQYILDKASKSCSLSVTKLDERIGGNMPNYASALSALAVDVDCIGALGYPLPDEQFTKALSGCTLHSVSDYGTSLCLEFLDGKVMIAQHEDIEALDYTRLTARFSREKIATLFNHSDLITFLNWSEMKEATSIWLGLAEEVLPQLTHTPVMLVDFSDCSAKSRRQVDTIMSVLTRYAAHLPLYLSLNLNEAEQLAVKLSLSCATPTEIAAQIRSLLDAQAVVIHLTDGCTYVTAESAGFVANQVIAKPAILTGGGDNFNAGLSFGLLMGEDLEAALLIANAVSGYYVSHGHSPSREALADWISNY